MHVDIDECATRPCDNNGQCNNTPGNFSCTCNTGYTGDGFVCYGTYDIIMYNDRVSHIFF